MGSEEGVWTKAKDYVVAAAAENPNGMQILNLPINVE